MKKITKAAAAAMFIAILAPINMANACDLEHAARCQEAYFYTVNTICPLSFDPASCRQGALLSYSQCKDNAGCRG